MFPPVVREIVLFLVGVDHFLQIFARIEFRHITGGNSNGFFGLGVDPRAALASRDPEGAESDQADLFLLPQSGFDDVDRCFEGLSSLGLGQISVFGDFPN